MECNFNPIHINSIQSFVSIHGRCTAKQKQVYFVRADGSAPSLLNDISAADRSAGADKNTAYCRLVRLAPLTDTAKVNTYLQKYQDFKKDKSPIFPQYPELSAEIVEALTALLRLLRQVQPELNETAERNTAVQLLYRTEQHLLGLLTQRKNKFCKLIYSGCGKNSEFLFGYLAALLGIDTLILMPEGTGKISPKLMKDCTVIEYGSHERVEFPEFRPSERRENISASAERSEYKKMPNIKVTIPPRTPRSSSAPDSLRSVTVKKEAPKEKSYEELALLAESVVMIIVGDEKGEPFASGSGIAVHPDGYILTSWHVIDGGHAFGVRFENDEKLYGGVELIKYHPEFDLALIRIDRKLKPLPLYDGRRELRRGEKVVAIGSPMGLFNSVSDGIISGFRKIKNNDMIQFTAPVSPGSSGGALLNCCGEIIGICLGGFDEGQNLNVAVSYKHIGSFASNIKLTSA